MGKPQKKTKKRSTTKGKRRPAPFNVGDPITPSNQSLPVGGAPGTLMYWDGLNWVTLQPPAQTGSYFLHWNGTAWSFVAMPVVPAGSAPGGLYYWDGFNLAILPPASGQEQRLQSGTNGVPYWAQQ